jgi:hypothetical protein
MNRKEHEEYDTTRTAGGGFKNKIFPSNGQHMLMDSIDHIDNEAKGIGFAMDSTNLNLVNHTHKKDDSLEL